MDSGPAARQPAVRTLMGRNAAGTAPLCSLLFVFACTGHPAEPESVTYNEHIAPLIMGHCVQCHQKGSSAPFALTSYEDVKARAPQIARVTREREMPPWLPEPGFGDFAGARRLAVEQIELIARWVAAGGPEGEGERPRQVAGEAGWQLGVPDRILSLPTYGLAPGTGDVFRNFVIPTGLDGARFVRGVEFRASVPSVVHHAVIGTDRTRASRRLDAVDPEPGWEGTFADTFQNPSGHFVGWTPGKVPSLDSPDLAWPLERGADMVVQLHMIRREVVVPLTIEIGLYFSPSPPERIPSLLRLGSTSIDIPAGASTHEVTDQFTLPVDVEVLSVYPHAHYVARRMSATASAPGGIQTPLLRIDRWDFRWQDVYRYTTPVVLPRGTTIVMQYTYDNSGAAYDHGHNGPGAPHRVVYGPRSIDEMADLWMQVRTRSPEDGRLLDRAQTEHRLQVVTAGAELRIRREPENADARNALGAAYLQAGRFEAAAAQLALAIRLDASHLEAHNNLGLAYQARRDLGRAIVAFRQAVAIRPSEDRAHLNLANAYAAAGRMGDAVREWKITLSLNPDAADAHNNLGLAIVTGQPDAARRHFEQAIAIEPNHVAARNNFALMLGAAGRLDQAIAQLRFALALQPDYADAQTNLEMMERARADARRR